MSEGFGQPPAGIVPIPYVEYHTGPRRVLTLEMRVPGLLSQTPPIVSIDGRQYVVYWGRLAFEIPADRPCHVSVHLEAEAVGRAASILLPPGGPVTLTYDPGHSISGATLR